MKTMQVWIICAVFMAAAGTVFAGDAPSDKAAAEPATAAPASKLVTGYRGAVIPLPVDQLLYVKKGDRVDVLVTFDAIMGKKGETTKEKVTATILQNIVVLNVHMPENKEVPGAIELLCNPVEAQYVALSVAQASKINITVRAIGDTELHPMEIASFRKLIK
jgi:hypothetical protein